VLRNAVEPTGTACKPVTRDPRAPQTFTSADPRINEIERRVAQIGPSGVPVLIQGETGTGKEVLARSLHAQSTRANKPFLKLNCAALPSELVESELFGYERGAFTGAFERKVGIFELADGGTILLDEIGDMDIRLQAKLLQVLQDQEFRRIGGKETVRVNVRIMAATHRDLEKAIHDRTFREDLYYRLNVVVLHVPPLRERRGDIVSLGEFLIRKYADPDELPPAISADLRNAILAYNWPGNVRELENFMRKLLIFRDPDAMARDLQTRVLSRPPLASQPVENRIINMERRDVAPSLEQLTKVNRKAEAEAILAALESTRWNRKHASTILEIDYKSLLYKMKKLGIDDNPTSLSSRPRPPLQRSAGGD
jgi:two-component system response regulator AtoC